MNEEEKKAIEYMREFQKDLYGASSKNLMAHYLDTIFNLIDKQQKEIGELKSKYLYDTMFDYISKDKIREKIKEYKKQIEKDKKEIKESILRAVVIGDKEERIEILLELLEE